VHVHCVACTCRGVSCQCSQPIGRFVLKCLRKGYRIEDWLHFVECFSKSAFRPGVLPPKLKELWDLLVVAVEHFCRPDSPDPDLEPEEQRAAFDQSRDRAAKALDDYATKLQAQKFPTHLFTSNLHLAVCRLVRACVC
jgi:hypothetical protein